MVGTGWRYAVLQSMCSSGWEISVREVVGWVSDMSIDNFIKKTER